MMVVLQSKCAVSQLRVSVRRCCQFLNLSSSISQTPVHTKDGAGVRSLSSTSVSMMRKPLARQFLDKMRVKDQVSADYGLVYNSKLTSYIIGARLTTGPLGLGFLGLLAAGVGPVPMLNNMSGIKFSEIDLYGFLAFFALNIGAIMWAIQRVPLRIYYSDERDNFIFITSHVILPWKEEKIICECDGLDVNPSNNRIMSHFLPTSGAYILNGKKKIFLQKEYFSSVVYFRKLIGLVDLPPDDYED